MKIGQAYSRSPHHSTIFAPVSYTRAQTITRDKSLQQNPKPMSPTYYEPLPIRTHPSLRPMPSHNDYQIPVKIQEVKGFQNSIFWQQMMIRMQQLEKKAQKIDKIEPIIQSMQNRLNKFNQKVDFWQVKKVEENKQNHLRAANFLNEQKNIKNALQNCITTHQLQQQLKGLENSFKSLIQGLKTNLNSQVKQMHSKEKKRLIQIVAVQISENMGVFKNNLIKQCENKINELFKPTKNILGASKDHLTSSTLTIFLKQQLLVKQNGKNLTIATSQTKYYVDQKGFLMDQDFFYLMDRNNKQIKLSDNQLQIIKRQGLLQKKHQQLDKQAQSKAHQDNK